MMPDPATTRAILKALESSSYYAILSLRPDASYETIQAAFREFALQYHPDRYVHEPRESAALAAEVFKRGAEGFAVLSNPAVRLLYDAGLSRGHFRYVEGEAAQAALAAKPKVRTLEQIAGNPRAKDLAMRADRMLVAGKVEEARLLLTDAVQDDFDNIELKERLFSLYTLGGREALGAAKGASPAKSAPPASLRGPASGPPTAALPGSLESIATTPKAKDFARRADRLLAVNKFEEARVLLTDAVQDDFDNAELRVRLHALYTAGGYEKL